MSLSVVHSRFRTEQWGQYFREVLVNKHIAKLRLHGLRVCVCVCLFVCVTVSACILVCVIWGSRFSSPILAGVILIGVTPRTAHQSGWSNWRSGYKSVASVTPPKWQRMVQEWVQLYCFITPWQDWQNRTKRSMQHRLHFVTAAALAQSSHSTKNSLLLLLLGWQSLTTNSAPCWQA